MVIIMGSLSLLEDVVPHLDDLLAVFSLLPVLQLVLFEGEILMLPQECLGAK